MAPEHGMEVAGLDGTPFGVKDEGAGEEILLVHGGSNGPEDWNRVARALAVRFRVLRHTRFTYRSDPPPAAEAAMAGEVHDILSIAAAVGRPVVAVGHSSGAIAVLESARAEPSCFAGMLLYEPPLAATKPLGGDALRRARAALDASDADRAVSIFLREIVQASGIVVRGMKLIGPLWRRLRSYAPAQLTDIEAIELLGVGLERYRDLRVPALLLGGGLLSSTQAHIRLEALARVLPCVESTVRFRVHGHGAHYTAPRKLAQIIADFAGHVHATS